MSSGLALRFVSIEHLSRLCKIFINTATTWRLFKIFFFLYIFFAKWWYTLCIWFIIFSIFFWWIYKPFLLLKKLFHFCFFNRIFLLIVFNNFLLLLLLLILNIKRYFLIFYNFRQIDFKILIFFKNYCINILLL